MSILHDFKKFTEYVKTERVLDTMITRKSSKNKIYTTNQRDAINTYNPFIENFFASIGIHAENNRELKIKKYTYIKAIRDNIDKYYREYAAYNDVNHVTVKRQGFNNLVQAYHCYFKVNRNYRDQNAGRYLNNPTLAIVHFIDRFYNNSTFFNLLSGRYPYKMVVKYNSIFSRTFIVNNKNHLKETLIKLLFNIRERTNQMTEDGIEYVVGDDEVEEVDEEEVDEFSFNNHFDYMKLDTAEITMIKYNANIGRKMLKDYSLPNELSRSIINPNNDDAYCLIWNILINKFILSNEEESKKVPIKRSLNNLSKFPILLDKFYEYSPKWKPLYENGFIDLSVENIQKLEQIFEMNINIYTYIDNTKEEFELFYRSEFKYDYRTVKNGDTTTTVKNDFVARILYVPYAIMVPKKSTEEIDCTALIKDFEDSQDFDFFKENNGHFCTITNTCKFLFKKAAKASSKQRFICTFCDQEFRNVTTFTNHRPLCCDLISGKEADRHVIYENNKKDNFISFKNYYTQSKCPFVMFADTETRTDKDGHKLLSYMIYLKSTFDSKLDKYILRTAETEDEVGDKLCYKFMQDLTDFRFFIGQNVNKYKVMDPKERAIFEDKNPKRDAKCMWCESKKELVVHHDHNKKFDNIIGWLCQSCNIKEQKSNKSFSIFFHNIAYDLLVLIKGLSYNEFTVNGVDITTKNDYEIMAKNKMKYSSLIMNAEVYKYEVNGKLQSIYLPEIKFTDSYSFVSMSLSSIVDTMKMGVQKDKLKEVFPTTYNYLKKKYGRNTKLFEASTEKGLIAYDHCNVENLKSKDNLPIECYKNSLTLDLSDDYINSLTDEKKKGKLLMKRYNESVDLEKAYAKTNYVYGLLKEAVGEENMNYKVYFEYYLELDICLLADWFEFIRWKLYSSHGIDMVYYRGLPGFSQNCMLKTMKNQLHLIEDVNISRLIVNNLRGGYSGIVNKFCEIDEINGKRFIKYWDANNLYGYAMSKCKLANKYLGEITKEQFRSEYKEQWNDGKGNFTYFLYVDVYVLEEVHEKLERFPPLISKRKVKYDDLSEDSKSIKVLRSSYCSEKLIASLENQKNYLISIDNFKLYNSLGYKFHIKKVLKFEAEFLYDVYIELNSRLRTSCLNELEKALYKLLNNIIYGKSLENPEGYSNLELLYNEKIIEKRVNNPLLKSLDVIVEDKLVITDMHNAKMRYSTCVQAGFHILELSKNHMYNMLYNYIFKFCDENRVKAKLLMHDTDSFMIEFDVSESSYANEIEMMKEMKKLEIFDMHKYYNGELQDKSRKKAVGYLLDEFSDGYEITAFIGLASKSYLVKVQDKRHKDNRIFDSEEDLKDLKFGEEHLIIKGKGVNNTYLNDLYDYEDYKRVLNGELKGDTIKFNNLMKKSFANCLNSVEKIALSSFDDKFYNYKDGNELKSLPYGHYLIKEMKRREEEKE